MSGIAKHCKASYIGDDISNQQSDEFRDKFVMRCLQI